MLDSEELKVRRLGECKYESPFRDLLDSRKPTIHDVSEDDRVLCVDTLSGWADVQGSSAIPSFEPAGPRRKLYFDPRETKAGIVTCGGLCPGLNDVIRGIVMILWHRYGVRNILGFRNGYEGLIPRCSLGPRSLTPEVVSHIHEAGGTMLGSSRGPQDPVAMVDNLQQRQVNVLFTVGGDGTLRGAIAISREAERRGYPLAVIGVPKTIDNDIMFVDQSFGFQTAFTTAVEAIRAAHVEATGTRGGIGLVKVMGRHSGFVASYAALANADANFVLIPEVEFPLDGPHGLLALIRNRVVNRSHAVIVVGEGAGQHLCADSNDTDASGNKRLGDIGHFLASKIKSYLSEQDIPHSLKYIDPSYIIRSVRASPADSVYCFRLAAYAVHAAMSGRTEMLVGRWHGRFIHIPIACAVKKRQTVDPNGDLWLTVLESTGQPNWPSAVKEDHQTGTILPRREHV